MGFFTKRKKQKDRRTHLESQSLSGWDGVFHKVQHGNRYSTLHSRNPFQGGMGFFTHWPGSDAFYPSPEVAIPFRVGWGFSPIAVLNWFGESYYSRNPFQGGMGFFTDARHCPYEVIHRVSQSLSGWDGVFHSDLRLEERDDIEYCRNPFQGGMGFFTDLEAEADKAKVGSCRNPFQGGMGFFTRNSLPFTA